MDSVDIHDRARRANAYGPVLFVVDTRLIEKAYTGRLWVTKINPTTWAGKSGELRWFKDKEDLEENFVVGEFGQMIVARHCGGALPFKRYLKRIILDDPNIQTEDNVDFYSMAVGALHLAMQDSGLDVPIQRRQCPQGCNCKEYWTRDSDRLFQMFDPKV
ncbi:MAG TPA: hypothetical protein PKJ63_15755 [Cyclobacteriaceae bacterium]|nr:hypothetical protein [Cyclobacteriaceae bacterium]